MDSNILIIGGLAYLFYNATSGKHSSPLGPIGPVQNPNPGTVPMAPVTPPIKPIGPHPRPISGSCFGVTDHAFAPYSPNIKNPCPNNTFGWNLIQSPTNTQCSTFVGPEWKPALGGCINSTQPGSQPVFLLINNGKPTKQNFLKGLF
jgi:hypothetical protein